MMHDGMMYGTYGGMVWMVLCALFGVILLTGFVLLLVWAIKSAFRGGRKEAEEVPLDILKRRYASGEITREEYERMKHDISPGERP